MAGRSHWSVNPRESISTLCTWGVEIWFLCASVCLDLYSPLCGLEKKTEKKKLPTSLHNVDPSNFLTRLITTIGFCTRGYRDMLTVVCCCTVDAEGYTYPLIVLQQRSRCILHIIFQHDYSFKKNTYFFWSAWIFQFRPFLLIKIRNLSDRVGWPTVTFLFSILNGTRSEQIFRVANKKKTFIVRS